MEEETEVVREWTGQEPQERKEEWKEKLMEEQEEQRLKEKRQIQVSPKRS